MKQNQPKRIKKINVKRSVVREVVVKKTFKENIDVELTELTEEDIYTLNHEDTKAVAVAFRKLYLEYREIANKQLGLLQFVTPEPALKTTTTTDVSTQQSKAADGQTRHHSGGSGGYGAVGNKVGKTSIHHYVFWNTKKNAWGNNWTCDVFSDEDECALFVNKWLDENDDKKRPRNVVKEAYDETK